MDRQDPSLSQHDHLFHTGNPLAEKNTWRVVMLTAVMMVVEIVTGWLFGSMALLADGWHMSTHVTALGISGLAYVFARRHAHDTRFAFGTWKMEVLGAFASAIILGVVGLLMAGESIVRFFSPHAIHYGQAIPVAIIGLLVNLVSALLLKDGHGHDHGHEHHHHGHADLNLRSAYVHVIADAATSVLAILALTGGLLLGLHWLDPVMGLVGAALVSTWACGLLRDTSKILLDREMDSPVVQEIRDALEHDGARICDLHVWRIGPEKFACIVAIVDASPKSPEFYRDQLRIHEELAHVTVEVCAATPSGTPQSPR